MAHFSSSPASAANLKKLATPTRSSSGTRLQSLPANIEVEKKVELADKVAMEAFEAKVKAAGGKLVKDIRFTDCYYDSEELLLTRSDHFLRTRDGAWELKVPTAQSSAAASVYEEIEGAGEIAAFFAERFAHGDTVLPFQVASPAEEGCLTMDGDEEEGTPPPPPLGVSLAPFVEFTTIRRKWILDINGCVFNVDVDEASFGCCVAEFELMVSSDEASVAAALASIDSACASLGVVGAAHQDGASKFVQFIRRDPALLSRTQAYAPAVLAF